MLLTRKKNSRRGLLKMKEQILLKEKIIKKMKMLIQRFRR